MFCGFAKDGADRVLAPTVRNGQVQGAHQKLDHAAHADGVTHKQALADEIKQFIGSTSTGGRLCESWFRKC